jgi:hypothetical protein
LLPLLFLSIAFIYIFTFYLFSFRDFYISRFLLSILLPFEIFIFDQSRVNPIATNTPIVSV